jgi:endogenous inhibitor of DNA gyrase (YacG/DUF329 family)
MSRAPMSPEADRCATCNAAIAVRKDNPSFPFCSERCRLIDLGRWLEGDYRIPALDDAPSEDDDA